MNLTEEQIKMYKGLICPICKKETELVKAGSVYGSDCEGKMIRLCRDCVAWVPVDETTGASAEGLGLVAGYALRRLRFVASEEMRFLSVTTNTGEEELYMELSRFTGIPADFCDFYKLSDKSFGKVFDFFISKKNESGSHIKKVDYYSGERMDDCGHIKCDGTCYGCPYFITDSLDGKVYCDSNLSYFHLKNEVAQRLKALESKNRKNKRKKQ